MTPYAILTEFAPPDRGGIQASVGPLIEALGTDVTVIAPQTAPTGERRITRSLFSGSGWPRWWWLTGWLKRAQSDGLQLVIFGHFSAAVMAGWIACLWLKLPYAVLVHGNDILFEQARWPQKLFIGAVLRRSAFVGVNSTYVANIVRRYGVADYRIAHTHPFVQVKNIPSEIDGAGNVRILTIARLVARKNISALLKAFAEVIKKIPNAHLDIVGDGSDRQALTAEAERLGLPSDVTFHGSVEEEEKWRLLRQADLFVMVPTVRSSGTDVEGLGLVFLEAAACGLPIIASATGGVRDAVVDHTTGLVVDPDNVPAITQAMTTMLIDRSLATKYGRAGRERVRQEFTDRVRLTRLLTMMGHQPSEELPRVSVIIPAYNSAETIVATLQSVQEQTWKNIEIIVVDDGSSDNLRDVLRPFTGRITLIEQSNAGAPAARNAGFARSTGEYVLFLDADTRLTSDAITVMATALLTHPQAAFVYSDFYFGWKKFHLFEYSSPRLRQQNYIHTSSLIRRRDFPGFDPALKKFQDWDVWLTMDKTGHQGLWIPQVLFHVTQRSAHIGISTWLPSFIYRLPWLGQGRGSQVITKYRQAESIIRKKHGI